MKARVGHLQQIRQVFNITQISHLLLTEHFILIVCTYVDVLRLIEELYCRTLSGVKDIQSIRYKVMKLVEEII